MQYLPITTTKPTPWNKGRLIGQRPPLKQKEIWAIRVHLQLANNARDLALFNLALDSKLRGCDLVQLKVHDIASSNGISSRAIILECLSPNPMSPNPIQHFLKTVEGFGELFRFLSYDEIGTSTVQSRAVASLANETVIFCMPGSTSACQTAWGKIIREQLDSSHRPCNFVGVLKTRAEQKKSF